jgi:hypothetical protein
MNDPGSYYGANSNLDIFYWDSIFYFTAEPRRTQRCIFLFFAVDLPKYRQTGRTAKNKRALFLKII